MDQDATHYEGRPRPRQHCVWYGPSSTPRGRAPSLQFSAHVCCGQTAGWIKTPLGTKVGLGPGHVCYMGMQLPRHKGHSPPIFGPCLVWPNGRPSQLYCWALVFVTACGPNDVNYNVSCYNSDVHESILSRESKRGLLSHLTLLLLLHCLAKCRNTKMTSFHSNAVILHCQTSTSRWLNLFSLLNCNSCSCCCMTP